MAEYYSKSYGKPDHAIQVGICGKNGDQRKSVYSNPIMFKLASASGRLGNCGGGSVSPFTYHYFDKETGNKKDKVLVATSDHLFKFCKNINNIKIQPNLHFAADGKYSKDMWSRGYLLTVLESSLEYFGNGSNYADVVIFEVDSKFHQDFLPDGSVREIPTIVSHIDRSDLPSYFKNNHSIVIGTFIDLTKNPTERFYEISGDGVNSPNRSIKEFPVRQHDAMATNHSSFFKGSGSPMYLMNDIGQVGLIGIIDGSAAFENDRINNPVIEENCHESEAAAGRATRFVPATTIVEFLKIEFGAPAEPIIEFKNDTSLPTQK